VTKNKLGMIRRISIKQPYIREYNGAIYIAKWENIRRKRSFETPNTHLFEMDRHASIDVDTREDWFYSEFLLKKGLVKC
jgi:CMP-N-acetylneuraminic acid synthetase